MHPDNFLFPANLKRSKFYFFIFFLGDAEEGMGNSHGPPNSGMAMHNANATTNVTHDVTADEKPGSPVQEEEMQQSSSGDKSVLQAKLTNLAIQIGYGGKIKWAR